MASYNGKITLVDMRDVGKLYTWVMYADDESGSGISPYPEGKKYIGILYNQTGSTPSQNPDDYDWTLIEGRNLIEVKTTYSVSFNGAVPPIDVINFSTKEAGDGKYILTFADEVWKFSITNEEKGLLGAKNQTENDKNYELSLVGESLNGVGVSWFEKISDIPEIPRGSYLWTRTEYKYSDGTKEVYYSVSYQGQDGDKGQDLSSYKIRMNSNEIVKFVDLDGFVSFSPDILVFTIYKDYASLDSEEYFSQVKNLSENKFRLSIYDIKNDAYIDIDSRYIKYIQEGHYFSFKIQEFCGEDLKDIQQKRAQELLLQEDCLIRCIYNLQTDEGKFNLIEYINTRYGIRKDMASLSVEATKIVQSIRDSYLTFSETGLTIQNGGFQILDEEGNPVLQSVNGNLKIIGTIYAEDGEFSGELQGATGSFTGSITANSGTIGGFTISEGRIVSEKTFERSENGKIVPYNSIVLNGLDGSIFSQDITLGSGAIVDDFIQLGQAFIYNPDKHQDQFIKAGNISLNQNGILNLGSIQLHGGDDSNQAYIKSENGNWLIQEDGMAIFNDIYANNVHLQNTILEIGTVQAMGSLMLFKDSWSITSIEGEVIVIDGQVNLNQNDWIYSGQNLYKIKSIEQTASTTKLTLYSDYAQDDGLIITKFGQSINNESPQSNGFIFSILGEQNIIRDEREFASGNALTISDFFEEEGKLTYRKRLVLGQLDETLGDNIIGLGLYADNVFLNGSLTTKIDEDSYAGINTISEISASAFGEEDTSRIIFWAGSVSNGNLDIQNAPFQVTEKGSIFASKGVFKDSIISDSIIQGADIYAARIHGGTTEKSAELAIYDTSNGIVFRTEGEERDIFSIHTDGLKQGQNYFIEIENDKVNFVINTKDNKLFKITSNDHSGADLIVNPVQQELIDRRIFQNFDSNKITFGFDNPTNSPSDEDQALVFQRDNYLTIDFSGIWLEKDVYFGSGSTYMQYKKVKGGYDLFINE